ncbi:MAG TPA: hypothetical protein VFS41_01745 [Edaphobacter sp.]|uniref:Uncharacterized protein n=1 Tax=Microbispora hainanensis TaxID=568844 RepID=A0A544XXS5_9ACTN|nr:hypothetical protein [Microbispora hainanensis]TQS09299.1 hypothetical protein FLX08_38700 [Microbispora hainanensis]HEU4634873.1 hypothetical protein [Edaphobacter sp.]
MKSVLYPEPPHLSVGLYCERGERELFARVCSSTVNAGAAFSKTIGTAPRCREFHLVSDLGVDYREIEAHPERIWNIVNGNDQELRPIRVGFQHKEFGLMFVTYDFSTQAGNHAVSLVTSAGPLGLPDDLQSTAEKKRAKKWAGKCVDMARSICEEVDPLYAAIGIEMSMPTPLMLRSGALGLGDIFVSNRLLAGAPRLGGRLSEYFSGGHVSTWKNGAFFSSWGMLNPVGKTAPDTETLSFKVAELLGRTLTSWTDGPNGDHIRRCGT